LLQICTKDGNNPIM